MSKSQKKLRKRFNLPKLEVNPIEEANNFLENPDLVELSVEKVENKSKTIPT